MISFKKYTDIVGDIAKKLKVSKDKAVNALIKAQEKGINPLKWQSNIAMLTTFASIVAEYDPTVDERMMTDKQKLVQIQHYWDNLDHMASDDTKKKSLQRLGYKNIKLDSRGKITSFDEEIAAHAKVMAKKGDSAETIKKMHPEITDDELESIMGKEEERDYKSTKKAIKYHADEARNYRKEYDNYHAQPEQRERNAARLRARRQMVKAGKVEKFDKKDVHHKDNNPLNNKEDNLAVTTQNWNRTEPRLRKETFKSFEEYFHESRLDDKMDKYVSDEIKKRKLAKFPVNATDDIKMRMKPNKPAFKFPSPNSDMMIHVYLRKMTPPSKKGMMAFNYQLEDK